MRERKPPIQQIEAKYIFNSTDHRLVMCMVPRKTIPRPLLLIALPPTRQTAKSSCRRIKGYLEVCCHYPAGLLQKSGSLGEVSTAGSLGLSDSRAVILIIFPLSGRETRRAGSAGWSLRKRGDVPSFTIVKNNDFLGYPNNYFNLLDICRLIITSIFQ